MFTKQYSAYNDSGSKKPVKGEYHHIFIHKIVEKLNEGKDVNVVICGEKGNGKSMAALRLAEIIQNELNLVQGEFNPKENLIYDTLDYLDIMRKIDLPDYDDREDDINPNRQVLIVDEAGVQLNKSDYHSEMNTAFSDMLDIQRKANCLVIYALPNAGDLDVRIKNDVDFVVELIATGVAKITGYKYQHGRLEDSYRIFVDFNRQEVMTNPNLSLKNDNGFWNVDLPHTEELIKFYTEKENEYKEGLPEELYQKIKQERQDEEDSASAFDEILS